VHNRVKRFRSAGSPKRHRSWAEGFVAGRMLQVATPTERAELWEDRLSRLKETPNIWQEAHTMPYNSATTAVSKLRTRRHDISQGGSWQFRVEKRGAEGVVLVKWCGTPCTNCGSVSLDPNKCPLCGADKGAP
jgi:rubrerythrin